MNKIYKIVWNKALGQMVVVSEHAKSAAKGTTVGTHLSPPLHKTQNVSACPQWLLCSLSLSMVLLANAAWAGVANTALPTGANITQGSAQITQNHQTLNINQNSQNLSTNWNTFNIGKDATVNFHQPNQSSIAVNRVLDNNASQIMGNLNANGQVFLLNPNGIIFSKTAQVNVGGLVASTLNLSDSDIAQGKFTLKNNGNAGSVENYGSIIANGGVVALIAPTVKNYGTIQAHNGTVHLTAADQVTLQLQDGSLVEYQIDLGTLQGLVENGGAIQADNGAVYLTAQAKNSLSKAVVNHTGIIEANRLEKNAKGEIILLGDMQNGETNVSGTLKAEGKNGQDGGFIETSAADVKIDQTTAVSTRSDSGKTGTWLIDPTDFSINSSNASASSSGIRANTLASSLAINNVILLTSTTGNQKGDINVNADVTWGSANSLTLDAHNDININANITATNGKLNLIYGTSTANYYANTSNYYLNNGAKVNLKAGQNFSTQKGADTARKIDYTVITDLGAAGSTTKTDLQGMKGDLLGNYVLGADIDASPTTGWNGGAGFSPVGTGDPYYAGTTPFNGRFDGLGHSISNLYINRPTETYVGLFGSSSAFNSGGTFRHVGMAGVNVTGKRHVGGLVGEARMGIVENSYATGQVTGEDYVGGLVGYGFDGYIKKSYAAVNVTATSNVSHAGGLIGSLSFSTGRIENSYATGSVEGKSYTGGLVGSVASEAKVVNSYATGDVKGSGAVGGLVGISTHKSQIANSYATGKVEGINNIGGLVGSNTYGSRINNVYATGEVEGINNIGGLVGYNAITSNVDGVTKASISNAYSTGSVTGKNLAGGLVGVNDANATISNAYATGAVDGANSGGLVGGNGSTASISNVYATGAVVGANSGGLVGDNSSSTTSISNGYWNTETSVQANAIGSGTATGVTGLTTVQMKQGASFVGFDIDGQGGTGKVWRIYEGHTAPLLRSFLTQATLGTVANQSKTYNGQMQSVDLSGVSLAGLDSSKIFAGQSSSKNVGTYNAGYYSNQQGYDLIGGSASLTINKANLAITGLSVLNKVYDTNTVATLTGTPTITQFGSDSVTLSGDVVAAFANKNVGTNKAVTVTGFTLSGADAGNYNLVQPTGLKANITPATLTYTANPATSIYGHAITGLTGTVTGFVNGENLANATTGTASFSTTATATSHVGQYAIAGSGLTANNSNYVFVQNAANTTALTINPATLTYLADATARTYGATNPSFTGTVTGFVNGESLANATTGTAIFNSSATQNSHVGNYAINGSGLTANHGNYVFVQAANNANALTINKANLAITANDATKTYGDTTTFAGTEFIASGLQNGETVGNIILSSTGASATAGVNGGTPYAITASGASGGTFDANNYTISYSNGNLIVSKKDITVTANGGASIYGDSPLNPNFSANGLVNGETESVLTGLNNSFGINNTTNAGSYTLAVDGTLSNDNYNITQRNDATWTVNKAKAVVTANSNQVTYNGLNQSVSGFKATGLVAGEDESVLTGVSTTGGTGKNAGRYAHTASGTDGNYDLTFVAGQLEIDKAKATVTANSNQVTYNGQNQTASGFSATGLVNGEDSSVLTGVTASVTAKDAGSYTNKANGVDKNYDLTFVDGALDIAKAKATITANSLNTVYNGQNQTASGFSATGLVNGEDSSVLTGVTASVTAKDAGSYTNKANGVDKNYDLTFVDGALDIAKAKATITANSLNTVYNGQNQTASGFSATGLVNGEDSSVLTGVTASVTAKDAGSYTNKANGVDKNYDLSFVDGALDIAKAQATVTANSLNTVYNGQNQTVTGFTASGLVAGEDEAVLSNVSASVTAQEVGNYANKVTGSDDNYELTFVDGVLSIQAKPIWGNPYQRAIRTQPVQQKPKAFEQVEIEVEGQGINLENIQTLGSN